MRVIVFLLPASQPQIVIRWQNSPIKSPKAGAIKVLYLAWHMIQQ